MYLLILDCTNIVKLSVPACYMYLLRHKRYSKQDRSVTRRTILIAAAGIITIVPTFMSRLILVKKWYYAKQSVGFLLGS